MYTAHHFFPQLENLCPRKKTITRIKHRGKLLQQDNLMKENFE